PYGARELDEAQGVMKKCTHCIDRIYNETLPEAARVPACVSTCPASARHFGDLGDPDSEVSRLVAERGGYDLMPEMGYQPVNKYLPPRPRATVSCSAPTETRDEPTDNGNALLRWVDRVLSR
ncbi:MAG: 4Fe-4S dicluster domain-containing protein, partial [Acetobacteraceae bacterium]